MAASNTIRTAMNAFQEGRSGLTMWAKASPEMAVGAMWASLAAPLFMKNDERGYVKTSMITTPLIVSAAMVAPRIWPKAYAEGKRLIDNVRKVPTDYGFRAAADAGPMSFAEMVQAHQEGRLSTNQFLNGQTRFFSNLPVGSDATPAQIQREFSSMVSNFSRLYEDPTKHRLLENALFHSQLKDSGAVEKLGWSGLTEVAPAFTPDEMSSIIDVNSKNIGWIREMNFRLQQANAAKVAGAGDLVPQLAASADQSFVASYSYAGTGADMLKDQHANLYDELEKVIGSTKFQRQDIEVMVMPGKNKAINQIVGLRVGDLTIPVINEQGGVRMGRSFENLGVSRFFMQHGEDVAADVYGIRGLSQGTDFVRNELARAQFVIGRDPLNGNPFQVSEDGIANATRLQQKFYSKQGVFANLPGSFPVGDRDRGTWDTLRPERKVAEISHQVQGRGKIRTTGGTKLDTLELAETRFIEAGGVHNREKESLRIKSMNKAIWADVQEGHGGFSSTDWADVPELGVRSLQITPSQRALFGDLPEWGAIADDAEDMFSAMETTGFGGSRELEAEAKQLSFDLAMSRIGAKQKAIGYMAKDAGVNETVAAEMWDRLLPVLSNRRNYNAVRNIGYLGEGSRITKKNMGADVVRHMNYIGHENMLPEAMMKGGSFGSDQVLAMKLGVEMHAQGQTNRLLGAPTSLGDGRYLYQVEERLGMQGAKFHNLGKTTVGRTLEDGEMRRLIHVFDKFFQVTGQGGGVAGDVNSVIMEQFNSAKANNPLQILNDAVGDTFRRLAFADSEEGKPFSNLAFLSEKKFSGKSHLDRLSSMGYTWNGDKLVTQTAKLRDLESSPIDYIQSSDYIKQLMDDVGARIKSKQIAGDRFMASYIDWSMKHEHGSYLDYVIQRGLPESVSISDHMALNHASQVGVTRDALQQLALAGEHDTAREILSRLKSDGSTGMTLDFIEHTDPSNLDFSKQFGEASISIENAVGNGAATELGPAGARAMKVNGELRPNIFDPAHALAQKNYSIKANVAGKDYFIPVLGREAYGGKVNEHDLMGYSANKWESELGNVLQTAEDLNEGFGVKTPFEEVLGQYVQKVRESFGVGKESVWRAPNVDPLGFEGRAASRASTLRYADGAVNPFEIGVGREYLSQLPAEEAAHLRAGGRLQAVSLRHPINATVQTYVKYDENLNNSWQVASDPLAARMARMDADGDRLSFHLVNTKMSMRAPSLDVTALQGEELADYMRWKHFDTQIMDPNSLQGRVSSFREVFEGQELDPRKFSAGSMTDLFPNFNGGEMVSEGALRKFAGKGVLKSIQARTAAADVGMLSNTFDLLETSMGHNDLMRDPFSRMVAHEFSYDIVREASIAAQKLKGGGQYQDLTTLMAWNNELRNSLIGGKEGRGRNLEAFLNAMESGAKNFGKTVPVNDAHRAIFEIAEGQTEINPYHEFTRQKFGRDLLTQQWRGHDSSVTELQHILSVSNENATEYAKKDIVSLFNNKVPMSSGYARRGSSISAAALGAENAETMAGKAGRAAEGIFNQAVHSAEDVMHAARGTGAMKVLGIGAAVAAGAGILFGSLKSPRSGQALAPSGNAYRPEEKMGVDGHVPGEAEAGSMAPANPPRRVRPARGGVRTAVVAPMGRATELEVNLKADERGRAAEATKMATRLAAPSGSSSTSITYRDTTRLDSLRTRQKIRDVADER